jgi:anti-sigma factor RsiW
MNSQHNSKKHIGELLSGYVDGELTQQQRQIVEVHCRECAQCEEQLRSLKSIRSRVGNSKLSPLGEDQWRERSTDQSVVVLSHLGWFIALTATALLGAGGLYVWLVDATIPVWQKLAIGGVYAGGSLLLLSVLRQRVLESKTDKYNDVEI